MKKKERIEFLERNFNCLWDKYMANKADLERTSLREVHLECKVDSMKEEHRGKIAGIRITSLIPIVVILFNHFLPSTYGETIFLVCVLICMLLIWAFTL